MDIDNWYAPTSPDDVEDTDDEIGLIYTDGGQGYTPNEVRMFIDDLQELIDAAEDAVRRQEDRDMFGSPLTYESDEADAQQLRKHEA